MPKVLNKYKDVPDRLAVYIGRPTIYGNPFAMVSNAAVDREDALKSFAYFVKAHPELVEQARRELHGRDLICFCKPKDCHGDLWLYVSNDNIPLPEWMKGIWDE